MPQYWPDKPHAPAHRGRINRSFYALYLRYGSKSRFWSDVWDDQEVFRVLRVISRQHVNGFIADPAGGPPIWSLSNPPADVQENRYPLNTCLLRGWIEVLNVEEYSYEGFPIAQPLIPEGGSFKDFSVPPYYRVTTAGWNALNRSYTISRLALIVSLVALTIAVTNLLNKRH